MSKSIQVVLITMVVSLSVARVATAADPFFEPSVAAEIIFDDNISLETDEEKTDVFGTGLSGELLFGVRTPTQTSSVLLRLEEQLFDESEFDTDDYRLELHYDKQFDTEGGIEADIDYSDASALLTEFEDSGDLSAQRNRRLLDLKGLWWRQLTQKHRVEIEAEREDTNFSTTQDQGDRLVDFSTDSLLGIWRVQHDTRTEYFTGLGYEKYAAPTRDNTKIDTAVLLAGIERIFSPAFTGSLSLGLRRNESRLDIVDTPDADTGQSPTTTRVKETTHDPEIGVEGRWQFEVSALSIRLSQTTSGSSEGELTDRRNIRLSWVRKISPVLDFTLKVIAAQTDSVTNSTILETTSDLGHRRRRYEVEPKLTFRISRNVSAQATYRFRRQDNDGARGDDTATSNAIFASITYRWF